MLIISASNNGGTNSNSGSGKVPTTLIQLNIVAARKHFEKIIPENA
jgi:hypothetical protein